MPMEVVIDDKNNTNVSFTLWTKPDGILTKTITKNDEGAIIKDSSQCRMSHGTGQVVNIPLSNMPTFLNELKPNQALTHGVPKDTNLPNPFTVISDQKFKKIQGSTNIITRTLEHLHYPPETPILAMIDYDPAQGVSPLPMGALIQEIDKVIPGFQDAEKVRTHSTSACVFDQNGQEVTGPGAGYHIYFTMPPGTSVPRFVEIFKVRSWLMGHGYIKISKSGAMLLRNGLFDEFVLSPERQDFVAGAIIPDGWEQRRPEPIYIPGSVFSPDGLPDLLGAERAEYESLVRAAKGLSKDKAHNLREEFITTRAADMHVKAPGIPLNQHEATIRQASTNGDLYGDFMIHPDNMDSVTVKEILKNPSRYDGVACADPLEPDNTSGKAKIFINFDIGAGKPVIQSFLHGDHVLFLHSEQVEITTPWSFDDAEFYLEVLGKQKLSSGQKVTIAEEILEHNDFGALELDIVRDILKKKFSLNKKAQDSFINSTKKRTEGKDDSRTHIELSMDFRQKHYPDKTKAVGCEGDLWEFTNNNGLFRRVLLEKIERLSGYEYRFAKNCKKGSDYKSITRLLYNEMLDEDFFKRAPYGLPGKNFFYQVEDNSIKKRQYTPSLRQRFKLVCEPDWGHKLSRFIQFIEDTFQDDEQQITLLQEIVGALVTGTARKLQKAFLFYGSGANGKSVVLDICNGLFSEDLKCSIKPDELSSEYYKAQIAGKALNIVGELDKSNPIKADFKDIVGCDTPVTARLPYKEPFSFTPFCGHLFACNGFPQTRDHSYGFYRRWVLFDFRHTVPENKRIPSLGKIILKEELPGILAWALDGAQRLIENGFVLADSVAHEALMDQWKNTQDSVSAFLADDEWICINPNRESPRQDTYAHYRDYCYESNVKALGLQNFYSRVNERYAVRKPSYGKRVFVGLRIIKQNGMKFF